MIKKILLLLALLNLLNSAEATSLAQFRFVVRDIMEDSATRHHSDATIDSAVNRTIVFVTNACSCIVAKDSFNTVSATKEYVLKADFKTIQAVYNSDKKAGLYQISVENLGKINPIVTRTHPSYFYIFGRRQNDTLYWMGLDFTPTEVNKIYYWYFPKAKKLTSGAVATNLPDEFHTAVIYRTIEELYAREYEYEKSILWGTRADKEIIIAKSSKFRQPDVILEIPKIVKQEGL